MSKIKKKGEQANFIVKNRHFYSSGLLKPMSKHRTIVLYLLWYKKSNLFFLPIPVATLYL